MMWNNMFSSEMYEAELFKISGQNRISMMGHLENCQREKKKFPNLFQQNFFANLCISRITRQSERLNSFRQVFAFIHRSKKTNAFLQKKIYSTKLLLFFVITLS